MRAHINMCVRVCAPDGDGSFGIISTVRSEMSVFMYVIIMKIVQTTTTKVDDVAKILRTCIDFGGFWL